MKKGVKRRWSGWWRSSKPRPHPHPPPPSGARVTTATVTSRPSQWTQTAYARSLWTTQTTTARTRCWASPGSEWSNPPDSPGTLRPIAAPSSRWASPLASVQVLLHPVRKAHRSLWFQEESDEDLVGLLEESDRKRKNSKPRSSGMNHGNNTAANRKRDEDDSDEDLLRVWCHFFLPRFPRPPIWTLLSVNVSVTATATTTMKNQQHVESRKRSSLLGLFFVGLHLYSTYSDSIQSTVYRLSVLAHEFYLLIADYLNCSSGQCLTCTLRSLIFCHNSEMKKFVSLKFLQSYHTYLIQTKQTN